MATATDDRSVLDAAATSLAALVVLDLDALGSDDLSAAVLQLHRMRGALEAVEARVLARWDADRVWQSSGAKTGAAWLAHEQRIPIQTARQRIRHARDLRALPEVAAAWAAGEIDRTHLTTILGARNERTAERFSTDHTVLLEAARIQGFVDFKRTRDRWVNIVDPDGAEQHADHQRAAREVHLSKSLDGMWFGRTTLDPISGEIVGTTLAHIDNEVRDRTCFHPYCDEVPARPHIDHIHEYSKGGPTTQRNTRQGCDFHNLWRTTHPDDWTEPGGPDPPGP